MNQQSPQHQPSDQPQVSQQSPSPHDQRPPSDESSSWSVQRKIALIGFAGAIIAALIGGIFKWLSRTPPQTPTPTTFISTPTLPSNIYPPPGWKLLLDDSLKVNNGNWSTDRRPDVSICHFTGDAYQITQETLGYPHYCRMGIEKYTNFAFEVQMMIIKGDQGGIYFRSSDERNISCYYFRINREGGYVFDIYDNNRSTPLVNGTDTTAIHTGFNQPNLIAVVAQGNKFYLYANRQLITVVGDQNNSYSSGYIGLTADSLDKPTEVLYSNLKMWNPSSS